jgi:hypothetical protein
VRIVALDSDPQRRLVERVCALHVSTLLEQQLHNRIAAVPSRSRKGRLAGASERKTLQFDARREKREWKVLRRLVWTPEETNDSTFRSFKT